jgi:pyruvate dehydrogenase E2 component (dihydrolipoamide acetyltransferase)
MAVEVKLEELAPNLEGGTVLDVKVAEGDTVTEGQTLLELEAEKATLYPPAPIGGRISKLAVKKNDQIKVGQTLCFIEGAEAQTNGGPAPAEAPRKAASVEAPPAAGPGDGPAAKPAQPARPETTPVAAPDLPTGSAIPAGPATRLLAREWGIDLRNVPGSGRSGRITREDVKQFVKELAAGQKTSVLTTGVMQAPALPDFEKYGAVERQALSGIRKATAKQMALAWSQVPHVTQHDLADVTDLEAFRRALDGKGPRLTITAFALKGVAILLRQFPQFNSSLDLAAGQLILKRHYHLGVAVDTEGGLLVPVLRDVDKKSIHVLAAELTEIAERARQRKISTEDMRGGTFTITNLGGIGGTAFTPIVNYPEVAILGMSRARLQAVVSKDGTMTPRLLLPLSLSYDHRVIDGADAARFTRRLADLLEQPLQMLLEA